MQRSWKPFLAIALAIASMIPLTAVWGRLGSPSETISTRPQRRDAINLIEKDFESLQIRMEDLARSLELQPDMLRSLRQTTAGDYLEEITSGQKDVIRIFNRLPLPEYMAVELYNVTNAVLAWRGFILPLTSTRTTDGFRSNHGFRTVSENGVVKAIEYWHPLRQGDTVIGALRILHLVNVPRPEAGFEAYSLAENWQNETGLLVNVSWLENESQTAEGSELQLKSRLGRVLGSVTVREAVRSEMVEGRAARTENVMAFWFALLLGWIIAGLGFAYLKVSRAHSRSGGFLRSLFIAFAGLCAGIVFVRYAFHLYEIPGRWLTESEMLGNLFTAGDLASEIGYGVFRSVGEFLVSGIFALLLSILWLHFLTRSSNASFKTNLRFSTLLYTAGWTVLVVVLSVLGRVFGYLVHRIVEDSSLEYLRWSGLQPEFPVLVVYCGLLLFTAAFLFTAVGMVRLFYAFLRRVQPQSIVLQIVMAFASAVLVVFVFSATWSTYLTLPAELLFLAGVILGFRYASGNDVTELRIWSMRRLLFLLMVSTVLLYPIFFHVSYEKGKEEMVNVAEEFVYRKDEDVLFAINRVLENSREAPPFLDAAEMIEPDTTQMLSSINSLLNELNGLELGGFEVSVWLIDREESVQTRLRRGGPPGQRTSMSQQSEVEKFGLIQEVGVEDVGPLVRPVSEQGMQTRFLYEGAVPVFRNGNHQGWMVVRAEQRIGESEDYAFFISGASEGWQTRLSIAEFEQETLVRSQGQSFGRTRLPDQIAGRLRRETALWVDEQVYDSNYYTYYTRLLDVEGKQTVVAVRAQAVIPYDHLYYILRFAVSGLWILLPFYVFGLWLRRRAGVLPAPRVEFRDKVLNGFLGVGIISVAAMGLIGEQVLTRGDEEAVQTRLDRRLERFQEALSLDLESGVLPYRAIESILEKSQLDSLARVLSLELNVYEGAGLVATTRPEYSERRWIERRMSVSVYEKVYLENYRTVYATIEKTFDTYPFTVGYRAFPDQRGNPRYVVAILTTPEQQRIREKSARTAAYLFGSLLLLLLIFMGTATFLSSALARPMLRLRDGLRAVAAGRYGDRLPVQSRDEVGELVETFNDMQQQIQESQNRLAQQERQLAWNEMARQVAHEIKNPLTPMKLSVQHLQRAWDRLDVNDPESKSRFSELFRKITSTLSEQINALARIANEFASFARMPKRNLEYVDLNEVVHETIRLMQLEEHVEIHIKMTPDELIVRADREEMRRIFINLMKNGIQAMPDGGGLTIRTERQKDARNMEWAFASVQDSGTGIPVELRDKIFQPNFSTKTSGMGLGLAIIQKSVLDLGGLIDFETKEGEGTTFKVTLPLMASKEGLQGSQR